MGDSRAAVGTDRLPWLSDEPVRPATARWPGGTLLGWAALALLLVAAVSYWLGTRTIEQAPALPASVTSPSPAPIQAQPYAPTQPLAPPDAQPVHEPEVHRVTERSSMLSRPAWQPLPREVPKEVADRVQRTIATDEADKVTNAQASSALAAEPATPVVPNTQNVKLWSARESGGAYGRVVQIGAFGSRQQAKVGWRYMSRSYPGVRRLPAVVVEARNSRGRPFYRFQIGTTSQAHSEVLCQRMEKIRFSCAVVGLPGEKRTVER